MTEATAGEAYDFVIVGAGFAGCVMADRLSESGQHRVLVIEEGPRDTSDTSAIFHILTPDIMTDWLQTPEDQQAAIATVCYMQRHMATTAIAPFSERELVLGKAAQSDERPAGPRRRGRARGRSLDDAKPRLRQHKLLSNGCRLMDVAACLLTDTQQPKLEMGV